jgi:chorismate synthase
MAIETDKANFLAGVRLGRTLGTPICILVENRDHSNWYLQMSPEDHGEEPPPAVTVPRPGHADLSGVAKYGFTDVRDVLERASARETVGRVAAGAICKALLSKAGVHVRGRVIAVGSVRAPEADYSNAESVDWSAADSSPVGCDDVESSAQMCTEIDQAKHRGESLGGIFEIWCWGLLPGIGGYSNLGERLDGRLMGALGSIPAIKGVEIGAGFANAALLGSAVHDVILFDAGREGGSVGRVTNRAAGLEGGMATGMPIVIRAAMKPIPTLTTPLASVDLSTMTETEAHVERSDVCAVPAARVVGEAMAAYTLASAYLEKFGGDSIEQFTSAVCSYEAGLEARGLWRRSSS